MLVHVTRYNAVQNRIHEMVSDYVSNIWREIRYGQSGTSDIKNVLKKLWESDYVKTTYEMDIQVAPETWELIESQLLATMESIKVKEINGSAGDVLDYKEYNETGLNVIAVGGDKLSRGLTLDGLTVSYYLRTSKMYDTLMQMGRWFGYRDGYKDLCRIYTTGDLVTWFRHIATAMEELRDELQTMAAHGATPEEFGLKVMAHPIMSITSQVKMKTGIHMKLSYAGSISETTVFDLDEKILESNFILTDEFVSKLGTPDQNYFAKRGRHNPGKHLMWDNVDGSTIIDFLNEFKTHKYCTRANARYLSQYITKQYLQGELTSWSVALINVGDSSEDQTLGGHHVGRVERNTSKDGVIYHDTIASIKRLVTPDHELFDLNQSQKEIVNAEKMSNKEVRKTLRDKKNGLLLIYPLDVSSEVFTMHDLKHSPIGIALSFPGSDTALSVDYVANNVFGELELND
ncbi:hypothetical protein CBW65_22580 [Tumebacillus avium]|uniref:Putative endonuclease Z1 domain-containing protein n=1 Tax=Tumebacillus avium TaxID=1903704 RepID=A0A1Y0IVV7_9BACL|nr:Z1 domain-containing protein [Tumebacillus avium]ARU63474.1 hypothetical protein CBW65_22580 [Tumebacillus avium]